jgi:GT2 family glycosyltransferase
VIAWPALDAPAVSVVVVTYGDDVARSGDLMRTLAAQSRHHRRWVLPTEVIVVVHPDDTGASCSGWLAEHTSGLNVVEPGRNLGFGGGCNAGVAVARGEVIALVNPDLEVTEGWLEPLVAQLDDPTVAIAAPPLLHPDGSLAEAGQVIFADGGTEAIGGPRLFTDARDRWWFDRDVDYASAACWVMRRSTFEHLGGFDPAYFPAYFEDADLAMVARQAGLVTRLVVARPVIHHHAPPSPGAVALAEASRRVFEQRWAHVLPFHITRPATLPLACGTAKPWRSSSPPTTKQAASPPVSRDSRLSASSTTSWW